jgi:isocitrate dehydrogenase
MRNLLLPRRLLSAPTMARASVSGSAAAAKALLPLNPGRGGRLPSLLPARLPLNPGSARVLRGASLRCYAAAAAVAEQSRIKVQNPIVEMDGTSASRPSPLSFA